MGSCLIYPISVSRHEPSFDIYQTSNLRITSSIFAFVRLSVIHCITTTVFLVAFKLCFAAAAVLAVLHLPLRTFGIRPRTYINTFLDLYFTSWGRQIVLCIGLLCVCITYARNTYDQKFLYTDTVSCTS